MIAIFEDWYLWLYCYYLDLNRMTNYTKYIEENLVILFIFNWKLNNTFSKWNKLVWDLSETGDTELLALLLWKLETEEDDVETLILLRASAINFLALSLNCCCLSSSF